ncbi:hypothetical protein KC360_g228 [Hortaea werneckii]|nr:hypothetical protein KC344_g230 [Hortaea werneckii]KAI7180400.1 hypothetical protein KC360_g228 [Hortaea werneckii]
MWNAVSPSKKSYMMPSTLSHRHQPQRLTKILWMDKVGQGQSHRYSESVTRDQKLRSGWPASSRQYRSMTSLEMGPTSLPPVSIHKVPRRGAEVVGRTSVDLSDPAKLSTSRGLLLSFQVICNPIERADGFTHCRRYAGETTSHFFGPIAPFKHILVDIDSHSPGSDSQISLVRSKSGCEVATTDEGMLMKIRTKGHRMDVKVDGIFSHSQHLWRLQVRAKARWAGDTASTRSSFCLPSRDFGRFMPLAGAFSASLGLRIDVLGSGVGSGKRSSWTFLFERGFIRAAIVAVR